MKNVFVLVVAVVLGLNVMGAENVNNDLKQEIANSIEYPAFAKDNLIEGTVWLQLEVDENSQVQVLYWSATNVELGQHVKKQVKNFILANKDIEKGQTHDLKLKFELNTAE